MPPITIAVILAATVLGGISGGIGAPFGHYLVERLRNRKERKELQREAKAIEDAEIKYPLHTWN